MTALYLAGDQAAALAAYRALTGHLADREGLDPTPELQERYQSILRGDLPRLVPATVVPQLMRAWCLRSCHGRARVHRPHGTAGGLGRTRRRGSERGHRSGPTAHRSGSQSVALSRDR